MAISFPEFGPWSAQMTAKKNVGVISGFLIGHAFAIGDVSDQLTGFEYARQIPGGASEHDQNFRRRVTVATLPKRIGRADNGRQAQRRAVEIDGAGFTVIPGEDFYLGAFFRWQ